MKYSEFLKRFPVRNGVRQNRIELACLLHREFRRTWIYPYDDSVFRLDLDEILDFVAGGVHEEDVQDVLRLGRFEFRLPFCRLVDGGMHESSSTVKIEEAGRVSSVKAGKLLRRLILWEEYDVLFPEQLSVALCERFAALWKAEAEARRHQLVLDDDFEAIYDSSNYAGEIHSCMSNRGLHGFYNNSVKAKAASLRNRDGEILARCVVFTEVNMNDGRVLRLAERQYAVGDNQVYKKALVNRLIEAGAIDGYKDFNASYDDAYSFRRCDGKPFSAEEMEDSFVTCDFSESRVVSYQDSFKEYNPQEGRAYLNDGGWLTTTSGRLPESEPEPETAVFHDGVRRRVDEGVFIPRYSHYALPEQAVEVDGRMELKADVVFCPVCGRPHVSGLVAGRTNPRCCGQFWDSMLGWIPLAWAHEMMSAGAYGTYVHAVDTITGDFTYGYSCVKVAATIVGVSYSWRARVEALLQYEEYERNLRRRRLEMLGET